eukprot:5365685-Pyramimonas_sp.AAC.1
MGLDSYFVECLLDAKPDVIKQVNEVRGALRFCGKCRRNVRSRASVAYWPLRVNGAAGKMELVNW